LHAESRRFPGNAYRNVSVHTATHIQSTVTARNAVTLLLKEVRPKPTSGRELSNRRQKRREHRRWSRKSEVKTLVYVASSLPAVTKCYSYSNTVLQLTVVPPAEYPVNRFIQSGPHELLVALPEHVTTGVRKWLRR
jgi:hypothetical protein